MPWKFSQEAIGGYSFPKAKSDQPNCKQQQKRHKCDFKYNNSHI